MLTFSAWPKPLASTRIFTWARALERPWRCTRRLTLARACPAGITPLRLPSTDGRLGGSTVRITREGWAWLVLAGILWGTGLYKGINLLSFLGLLMLAAWMIQWLGARRRLSHLGLRRWTDNLVFAETPFTLTVEVSNPERRAPFGVVGEDHGAAPLWASFIPPL